MVSIDTHPNHAICWVDLAAKDLDGATNFYAGLLGWTTENDGVTPYSIFMSNGQPVGGVMQLAPEMDMPGGWSIYVATVDADATLAAVNANGGTTIQEPFDIPGGNRIAVFADPAGAVLCLFEGTNLEGIKVMDEVGAPCWFDCVSRDVDAGIPFYERVFGWSANTVDMGMPYTVFSNGDAQVCGTMAMPDDAPEAIPSVWAASFVIEDADAAAAYVTANGGTITTGPNDTPFGRMVSIFDPWGGGINLIDRSTATAT